MTIATRILDDGRPLRVGGLTLPERVAHLSRRAGLDTTTQRPGEPALPALPTGAAMLVVGPHVLVGPSVLAAASTVAEERPGEPLVAMDGQRPCLLFVPPTRIADVSRCESLDAMVEVLRGSGSLRAWPLDGGFCRVVEPGTRTALEHEYIRHLNGRESFFTKRIRRFSVPLTSVLVTLGATPTQVTFGGLLLASASAWWLAQGHFLAGLLGACLYYISMVFDCSDGEVARLTLRDSAFGAWFETVVDYLTYGLLLVALTAASAQRADAATLQLASLIALSGSCVVAAAAGYLRYRVAKADPGRFDDASAEALGASTPFHRFARWGRQWIKRSSIAHLIVALALVDQTPVLLYIWAFGASVAAVVIVLVMPFVVARVDLASPRREAVDTRISSRVS